MSAEPGKAKRYTGRLVDVTFEPGRCLHAAECIRGLPYVFDLERRPWIQPDGGPADLVAEVVRRCPTGALQYRFPEGPAETAEHPAVVGRNPAGQLLLRGELVVDTAQGARHETRVMLCGCGASGNQPYCDHAGPCGGK
ncbi:(4Fe-4S)-binding protein [Streptomyces sp. H27-C3]|uniref:(4Fe-4S)-binding protein n=1 Tax=Streptomyces sp. H27-C3 TaxID=3046305 RepID=UPI0024BB07CD|nr:(4Fe-4S)-binding protein [Streptomyces sp. H27-C3]MDJ0462692.1 (4Fe-4S)-binding protein [Streptomyces sp. H27-C3]